MIALRFRYAFPGAAALFVIFGGWLPAQVRFEVRAPSGVEGQAIEAGINQDFQAALFIVNPGGVAVEAFQMAVTFDPAFLDFSSGAWRGTALETPALRSGNGPQTFEVREVGPGQLTVGVTFENAVPAPTFTLDAGQHSVALLTFRAIQLTAEGTPTRVAYSSQPLGNPPIGNIVADRTTQGPIAVTDLGGANVEIGAEQAYGIAFREGQASVDSGAEFTVPIVLFNNPNSVDGFSFGVRHDPAALDLVDATFSDSLKAVMGSSPDDQRFQSINKSPAGAGGFTVAVALSARDASKVLAAAGSPHEVVIAKYRARAPSGSSNLSIAGDLGSPRVEIILDLFGVAQRPKPPSSNALPTQMSVTIKQTTEGPSFIRGDVDQNRRISLTDAIGILSFQFDAGNLLPAFKPTADNCLIAFNVNGDVNPTTQEEDESRIDVTDAIYILNYQFLGGPEPPAPFGSGGDSCAVFTGKASARMTCTQFACQ